MTRPTLPELRALAAATHAAWLRGDPVFRLAAAFRSNLLLYHWKGKAPCFQWLDEARETFPGAFPDIPQAEALQTAIIFATAKTVQASATSAWFRLSESLAHALIGTRLVGVLPADLRLPFPGFYLELPPGIMTLYHRATGEHDVRAVCVVEGATPPAESGPAGSTAERRLLVLAYCEPNENSKNAEDDNILYFSIPLDSDGRTIEELIDRDHRTAPGVLLGADHGGTLVGSPRTVAQLRDLLRGLVVNFLVYLAAPGADVVHQHQDRIRRLRRGKRTRRGREQIERLQEEPLWHVGSRIVLDPRVRESIRHAGTGRGRRAVVNVLVRGHWRRQWSGPKTEESPKGQKCELRWIRPVVRNYDPASKVLAHEYDARGGK